MHHSTSVKHSPDYEVHDEKALQIVQTVLRRLDRDRDGFITQREFINGGPGGLPAFEEFGKGILGHHYGELFFACCLTSVLAHGTPNSQTRSRSTLSITRKSTTTHRKHKRTVPIRTRRTLSTLHITKSSSSKKRTEKGMQKDCLLARKMQHAKPPQKQRGKSTFHLMTLRSLKTIVLRHLRSPTTLMLNLAMLIKKDGKLLNTSSRHQRGSTS